jgi:hypothetical protein
MEVPYSSGKDFEKPKGGVYPATIIDVFDLGLVPSKNPTYPDPKYRIRIVWVLDAKDTEGRPFRIIEQPPLKISSGSGKYKSSRFYDICLGVLGTPPPNPFNPEALLGKSNQLFLAQEGEFVNIKGFLPLNPGQVAPTAPVGFVRERDKPSSASAPAGSTAAVTRPTVPAVNLGTPAQQAAAAAPQPADADIPF